MEIRIGDAVAHTAALTEIVSATDPGAEIQALEGGTTSSVLRVGDVVYKSPHSGVSDGHTTVCFDAAVAGTLPATANLATGTALAMPQLIASHADGEPPYNKLRYVPGEVLDEAAIVSMSEDTKMQLGRDLGSFVAWLGRAIPLEKFNDIQASAPPAVPMTLVDSLRVFRLPHLEAIRKQGYTTTAQLLEELTSAPPPPYEDPALAPLITGHGDLRAANMTFENERLRGIFDFGHLFPVDPAEELRYACLVSRSAVEAAADQFYAETQLRIPFQRIVHYAGAQAMLSATYCAINEAHAFSPSYHNFLEQYYPERDWSELDHLATQPA